MIPDLLCRTFRAARAVWCRAGAVGALVGSLVLALPGPVSAGDAPGEAQPVATPLPATAVPTLVPSDANVEPLDVWVPRDASPSPSPAPTIAPAPAPAEDSGIFTDPVELENADTDTPGVRKSINPLDLAQRPRRIKLSATQLHRLKAAAKVRREVLEAQLAALHFRRSLFEDPRGVPEVRLCSAALEGYGSAADIKRLLGAKKLGERAALERAFVRAVQDAGCDLVGIQGLLAVDAASGADALEKLGAKLGGPEGAWQGYVGEVLRESVRNAVLVRSDRVHVDRVESVRELRFVPFGQFEMHEMNRLPVKLTMTVDGKNGAPDRKLILIDAQLRQIFSPKERERETNRMQMADVIRQLMLETQREHDAEEEPPTVILLVDRQGPGWTPAELILDGRLRLIDFTENGGCTLDEKNVVSCKPPVKRGQELIGMLGDGLLGSLPRKQVTVDGATKVMLQKPTADAQKAERLKQLSRYEEIYLFAEDTPLALASVRQAGRYRSGARRLRAAQIRNPVVWTELNW